MGNSDNGYTKIPNEIIEAMFRRKFTQTQMIVILYVLRKTTGWNKPSDHIAISKLASDTKKKRQLISRTVSDLEQMGVLKVVRTVNGKAPEMSVNIPSEWLKPETVQLHATPEIHATKKAKTCNRTVSGGETVQLQEPETVQLHTKDIKDTIKDTIQKKEPSAPISEDDDDDEGWEGESWGE